MTIGDDLQIMLGLVPIRDRAGIQRGTMATEAARAAATDGNAEGQTLTRQTMVPQAPPKISLPFMGGPGATPDNAPQVAGPGGFGGPKLVPTRSDTKAVVPPVMDSTGGPSAAPTPAPRERVVAASPAAAPSPAVTRHSDMLLQAIEENKRKEKMQQLFSGIGLLANGFFNRNPDSSNTTQQALMSSGGGGKSGTDIATLKTLLDMRKEETNAAIGAQRRESAIQLIMDKERKSREEAELLVDSDKYKDYLGPEYARKREADSREQSMRQDLLGRVDQIATELKLPAFQVRAEILAGNGQRILDMLNPKTRAEIAGTLATTAKVTQDTAIAGHAFATLKEAADKPEVVAARIKAATGKDVPVEAIRQNATTQAHLDSFLSQYTEKGQTDINATRQTAAKTALENRRAGEKLVSYEEAKTPEGFARFIEQYDLTPTQGRARTANPDVFDDFLKSRGGESTETLQTFNADRDIARARGPEALAAFDKKYPNIPEWQKAKQQPHIEDPAAKIGAAGMTQTVTDYIKNEIPAKRALAESIAGSNAEAQNRWTKDIFTGGGPLSKISETALRTAGFVLNIPQERVADTQMFFNHMRGEAVKMRKELLPGSMSNDDRVFLDELGTGNREWSPETLQRYLIIQEKYMAAQLWRKNEETRRLKAEKPVEYQGASIIPMPPPNRFLRESLESPKGQEALNTLHEDPSPKNKRIFDEMYGKGRADYFLSGGQ